MATVQNWNPFGVALDITADSGGVTRTSAGQFKVKINASWTGHWSGTQTNYGMSASSGGGSVELNRFGNYAHNGSGSFTGTYGISGYGSQNKTITVTFRNFNNDNGRSATQNVSFNVTVPAWTSYTVSYDANGGTGAPGSQTKWHGENLVLSKTIPTRTGYTFAGWSGSDGNSYSAGATYSGNSNLKLTAKWNINKYTVTFKDSLDSSWRRDVTVNYDSNAIPPTPPSHTGYTFSYWDGTYTHVTSNRTVTAQYTINKYYIDVNGSLDGAHQSGTSPMGTFDIYINNSLAMNDAGDYWQEHNYQTPYRIQDIKANTGYNYTGSSGSALSGNVPVGGVSVTLNFATKKYTVSFNANLGEAVSNMPSSFTKTHFASVKLPTNVPTSRRYEFLGWSTSANGVVKYKPGDTYSAEGNATLYAIWELRASVLNIYDSSGNRRNGLLHIYNDDGELHYGIMFVYGSDGRPHEVV